MGRKPTPIDPEDLAAQAERLRRLARGLVRSYDRAEDVVQETCLRALTGRVQPRKGVAAVLGGVARNVAWKLSRGEARRGVRERASARREASPSTADLVARLDMQRRVLARVHALDEPYRSTILLRYFEGLSPREIARRLDVPVETVKTRLKRALERLRRALDAEHGGARSSWLAVLLPVAGLTPLAATSAVTATAWKTGGIVMQGLGTKVAAGAVAVLLLVGGALVLGGVLGAEDPQPGPEPELMKAERPEPGLGTKGAEPPEGAAETDPNGGASATENGREEGATTADAAEVSEPADASEAPGKTAPDPRTVRPAVRRSPFGLPKRGQGRRVGGGWGGPTGHWTKFGPMPKPMGTARIAVTVSDAEGNPLAGADVYLGPPDDAGIDGISFGDLRKLGQTDASGRLHAGKLPRGGAAVFANYRNRLNGPRGLDGRHGALTILRADSTVAVELTVPFAVGGLGSLEGVVVGPDGQPLGGAAVSVGWQQMWTKADGAFAFEGVSEGKTTLSVRRTGYAGARESVTVRAGTTTTRTVRLEYAEPGTVRLEGTVVGPQGEPVPHANVYLMITKDRGTNRSTKTDAQGRFVMEKLPERVRTEALRLQAGRIPHYAARVLTFEAGVPDERVRIELPTRWVQFELEVLDASTGGAVPNVRARAHRAESRRPEATFSRSRGGAHRTAMVEPGTHTVTIEALDHENMELQVHVVPAAAWTFRHVVRLKRVSPPTVQINLTVIVTDQATGEPVERAKIEVRDRATGEALARFEGRRAGGEFLMPGLSGVRRLVVAADGYEPWSAERTFDAEPGEARIEVALRRR